MKWIEILKAKKVKFGEPVFVKYGDEFAQGILKKIEDTGDGVVRTFQVATFADTDGDQAEVKLIKTVTHIAIP